MPRTVPRLLLMLACLAPGAVVAQSVTGPEPVDRAVQDVDPLATSLRRAHPGIARYAGAQLYQAQPTSAWDRLGLPTTDPATGLAMAQRYRYQAPGVRAWMARPDYLVRSGLNHAPTQDGEYVGLIPPGTVFDLVPRSLEAPTTTPTTAPDAWVDHRIDARLDMRIDTRVDYPAGLTGGQERPQINADIRRSTRINTEAQRHREDQNTGEQAE